MNIAPFELERLFAQHEFRARFLLSASDCESLSLADLLALADADSRIRWERLSLGYTESQGDPVLRAAIAANYEQIGPDEVVVLVPEEGIFLAMHALLEPGQHVIAMHPAYQSLHEVARALGCVVSQWPVTVSSGRAGWQLDPGLQEDLIQPATRLLVVNFPHNPTGFVPALELFEAILDVAGRHGLVVFSDEMYRGLEHDPAIRLPSVVDAYERGITLSGLSKTHAVPGLRLGWLATRLPAFVDRLVAHKDYTTICNSAASEALGLMAVRATRRIEDRNLALIQANLGRAQAFARQYADHVHWLAPQGGSIAFPAWVGPGSVDEFSQRALDQRGVLIVPARFFGHAGPHFRLGLGRANFPEALGQVEALLEQS